MMIDGSKNEEVSEAIKKFVHFFYQDQVMSLDQAP